MEKIVESVFLTFLIFTFIYLGFDTVRTYFYGLAIKLSPNNPMMAWIGLFVVVIALIYYIKNYS